MGLLLRYPLNGNINDVTGNTTATTIGSVVSDNEGKLNGSYNFSSGRLSIDPENLFLDKDLTIAFWIKLDSLPSSGTRAGITQTIYGGDFAINLEPDGDIQWYYGTSGIAASPYASFSRETKLSIGEWAHIVLWRKIGVTTAGEAKVFMNGEQVGATHDLGYIPVKATNSYPLLIGYSYVGISLPGNLEDFRIYDEALSTKEIKELAKGKAIHYKFNTDQQTIENEFLDNWDALVTDSTQLATYGGPGTLQVGATDPFGSTDSSIFRKTGRLRFGEISSDVGTLYYGNTYTFSIYLRHVYDENQLGSADFDICDRADLRSYSGNIGDNMSYTWKRFWVTAEHDNNITYHFIDVGTTTGSPVYEWCCPQIEERVRFASDGYTFYPGNPDLNVSKYTKGRTGIINDDSGNGNDVTLTYENSPYWVGDASDGRKSALFPGVNTKKIILDVDPSIRTDATTFSCWAFQIDTSAQHGTGSLSLQHIVSQGRDVAPYGFYIYTSSGQIVGRYGGSSGNKGLASGEYLLSKWRHIALTYDITEGGKLYVDGELTDSDVSIGELNYDNSYDAIAVGKMSYANTSTTTYFPFNGYIDDVRVYSTALNASAIKEIMQQRGSIDNTGNFHTPDFNETGHQPLILDYTTWSLGSGSATGFYQNGLTVENERIYATDPWGNDDAIVWECRPSGSGTPDGGWNSDTFDVDNTKMYRFSHWVQRNESNLGSGHGSTYLGCHGYGSTDGVYNRSSGANNTNPYFLNGYQYPDPGFWELNVGHVWPAGSGTGSDHPETGRYTVKDGYVNGNGFQDFVWRSETTTANQRSYLYYSTDDVSIRQQFLYPRVDVIDGTEPSIEDLLGGFDAAHIDYIRQKGGDQPLNLDVGFSETRVGKFSEVGIGDGLILWYPLQGSYTPDGSAYEMAGGRDGNITGDPSILSRGYNFPGTGQYINGVNITDPDLLDTSTNAVTFSGWINRSTTVTGHNMPFGQYLPYFSFLSGGYLLFSAQIEGVQRSISGSTTSFGNDEWIHFVSTYDGEYLRVYANGVLDGTSSSYPGNMTLQTSYTWTIGDGGFPAHAYPFSGKVSDVRIYNKVLSAEEIKILYDTTNPESTNRVKLSKDTLYVKGKIKEN